jgi:hypothetical protein
MNATTALSIAFLQGRVLTIKTAFQEFGVSNLPREVGRSIERKFGVQLSRVKKTGKSKYGVECWWNEYRLPNTLYNRQGREKMLEYVQKNTPPVTSPKTEKELSIAKQVKQLSIYDQ